MFFFLSLAKNRLMVYKLETPLFSSVCICLCMVNVGNTLNIILLFVSFRHLVYLQVWSTLLSHIGCRDQFLWRCVCTGNCKGVWEKLHNYIDGTFWLFGEAIPAIYKDSEYRNEDQGLLQDSQTVIQVR